MGQDGEWDSHCGEMDSYLASFSNVFAHQELSDRKGSRVILRSAQFTWIQVSKDHHCLKRKADKNQHLSFSF